MATLERPAPMSRDLEEATETSPSYLAPDVPTPFSTAELDTLRGGSSNTAEMAPQSADPFEDGLKVGAASCLNLGGRSPASLTLARVVLLFASKRHPPPSGCRSSPSRYVTARGGCFPHTSLTCSCYLAASDPASSPSTRFSSTPPQPHFLPSTPLPPPPTPLPRPGRPRFEQ